MPRHKVINEGYRVSLLPLASIPIAKVKTINVTVSWLTYLIKLDELLLQHVSQTRSSASSSIIFCFYLNKKEKMPSLNHFLQVPLTDAQAASFQAAQPTLDTLENYTGRAVVQCEPNGGPNITATVDGLPVFQARGDDRFVEISEPGLSSVVRCAEDVVETYVAGNLRTSVDGNKVVTFDGAGGIRLVVGNQGVIVNNSYALPEVAGAVGSVLTFTGGPNNDCEFATPVVSTPELIANSSTPDSKVTCETPNYLVAQVDAGRPVLVASRDPTSPGAVGGYTVLRAPNGGDTRMLMYDDGNVQLNLKGLSPASNQVPGTVLKCTDTDGTMAWGTAARIEDPGDPANSFVWCDSDNINVGTNYPTGKLLLGIQGTIIPGQVLTATSSAGACSWANPAVVNPFNQNLNTTNAVTFGSVSTPTLGAATTNVSGTLRVSSAYTMPTIAGSNGQVIVSNGAGASSWRTPSPGLFSQIAVQTVANNNVETTLLGVGVGTLTIPANSFIVGNAYNYRTGGVFRDNANNTTFRFRLRNSGVLFDSGLLTLPLISALTPWNIDTTFSYTGGTSMVTNFTFTYNNASDARGFTSQQVNTAFDPTIPNTLDFTVQWTVASANNTIQTNFGIVSKLY